MVYESPEGVWSLQEGQVGNWLTDVCGKKTVFCRATSWKSSIYIYIGTNVLIRNGIRDPEIFFLCYLVFERLFVCLRTVKKFQ
jgi:hypothetical protein